MAIFNPVEFVETERDYLSVSNSHPRVARDGLEVCDERPDMADVAGVPLGGQDAGHALQDQFEPECRRLHAARPFSVVARLKKVEFVKRELDLDDTLCDILYYQVLNTAQG